MLASFRTRRSFHVLEEVFHFRSWVKSSTVTNQRAFQPLCHNTFNGLLTRWIQLFESWPPVCCAKLAFLLHRMAVVYHFLPLCSLLLFSPPWNMFYYYPEGPPSLARVYLWILSSPCKANDLDPSHSQIPTSFTLDLLLFFSFFKTSKAASEYFRATRPPPDPRSGLRFVSLIPTAALGIAVRLPFWLEGSQLAAEQLGKRVAMTGWSGRNSRSNFSKVCRSWRVLSVFLVEFVAVLSRFCWTALAKLLWKSVEMLCLPWTSWTIL